MILDNAGDRVAFSDERCWACLGKLKEKILGIRKQGIIIKEEEKQTN